MRVFITGASGFIGMALTRELIGAGHQVLGLCRSEDKAPALAAAGAEPLLGVVEDAERIKAGAAACDAVVHLAFNHDFSQFAANCAADRGVVATLGAAVAGTRKPLLVTSGTAITGGKPTEDAPAAPASVIPRAASEEAARAAGEAGANVGIVRLSQVHDTRRQGLVSPAIDIYLAKGACAYIGEGRNRWPAAHLSDVARLYRLAVERGEPGATYHAVAEEGVALREIAETLAKRLRLPVKSLSPEEAPAFFGWLAMFAGHDLPASGAWTQNTLGWRPVGPGLLADLERLELPA